MAWGKKETWYKIDLVGNERSTIVTMEEVEDTNDFYQMQPSLEESDDVRRIKEEWTRLQIEADGLTNQLLRDAEEVRVGSLEEVVESAPRSQLTRGGPVKWQDVSTLPRTRLPSLDSMKDPTSTFPAISLRSSLRKNILEMRSGLFRPEDQADGQETEPPQCVTLAGTAFTFGVGTPTQTDIKWTPPANAAVFKLLMYDIEIDSGQGWSALTESRLPILRVYFTSDKIILGRFSRTQEAEPVSVRLRIRATGRVKCESGEETLRGPWSEEIWLTIEGSEIMSSTAI